MKQIRVVAALMMFSVTGWTEDVVVDLEVQPDLKRRLELTALEEFRDEFRPFDIEVEMAEMDATWNPHWTDSVRWEEIEKEAEDHFLDAGRHTAEEMITESVWFQNLADNLRQKLDLSLKKRYRQDQGEFGPKNFTLDVGANVAKASHSVQRLWLDAGLNFDHVRDPAIFIKWDLAKKGQTPYLTGRLEIEPVDQEIELRINRLPQQLDFRLRYNFEEEMISGNFLGIPLVEQRPQGINFYFGGRYYFQEEEIFGVIQASGDTDKLFGWLFKDSPRSNF